MVLSYLLTHSDSYNLGNLVPILLTYMEDFYNNSGLGLSFESCELLGAVSNTKLVGECSAIIDMISLFDSELSAYIFSFSVRGPQFAITKFFN